MIPKPTKRILLAAFAALFAAGVGASCGKDETPPAPRREQAESATTRPATRAATAPASRPVRTAAQERVESIIADLKSEDSGTRREAEARLGEMVRAIQWGDSGSSAPANAWSAPTGGRAPMIAGGRVGVRGEGVYLLDPAADRLAAYDWDPIAWKLGRGVGWNIRAHFADRKYDRDVVRNADEVVSVLVRALADENERVRAVAAEALGQVASAAKEAVGALTRLAETDTPFVRNEAERALANISAAALEPFSERPIIIEALIRALPVATHEYFLRGWAEMALREMRPDGLPVLCAAIREEDIQLRKLAAKAWGLLGAMDPQAIPALRETLKDEDPAVRESAVVSLAKLGRGALAVLRDALEDADPAVRRRAAASLGGLGLPAAAALGEALRDQVCSVRLAAMRSLTGMVPSGPDALTAALHAADPAVRDEAALALAGSRTIPRDAIGPLTASLQDDNPKVRWAAAVILARCGPAAAPAVAELIELLRDDAPALRMAAADALAEIGPAAAAAAPALREIVRKDKDLLAALAAEEALKRIGPPSP